MAWEEGLSRVREHHSPAGVPEMVAEALEILAYYLSLLFSATCCYYFFELLVLVSDEGVFEVAGCAGAGCSGTISLTGINGGTVAPS